MGMEGDLTWGSKHTIQYTDDVLQNCTPDTYVILLTNVTPSKFNKKEEKEPIVLSSCPVFKLRISIGSPY